MICANTFPPTPPISRMEFLGNGDFEYIHNLDDRIMLKTAFQAIELTNNWDFISQDIDTFMWSSDSRIKNIYSKIEELGYYSHSGCSFAFTLRHIQYLAQNGEEKFRQLRMNYK